MPITTSVSFDQATFLGDNDELRRLSHEEYLRLPIRERVRLLLEGKLKFYKDGQEVSATEALKG